MNNRAPNHYFIWINLIWFQCIWLIAVIYREEAQIVLGASLCIHFLLTPARLSDLLALLAITLLGTFGDSLLSWWGILTFSSGNTFIPLWLMLLWSHFALTLNHGMRWLLKLPTCARSLFGAVFGTLSYYAGAQLGSVILHNSLLLSLFALAVTWGAMLPGYIAISALIRSYVDENNNS